MIFNSIYDNLCARLRYVGDRIAWSKELKRILFLSVLVALGLACQKTSGPAAPNLFVTPNLLAESEAPRDLLRINSLAILPPQIDPRVQYAEGWPASVFSELNHAAREQLDLSLVPPSDVSAKLKASGAHEPMAPADLMKIGKSVGADGVLSTTVLRYVDRVGSAVGATTPAGVDFSMSLARVSDGKEVWTASYHFQDAALTENLFKVKERMNNGQGPGWRSANDLLTSGFRSALGDFSSKRMAQFSAQ